MFQLVAARSTCDNPRYSQLPRQPAPSPVLVSHRHTGPPESRCSRARAPWQKAPRGAGDRWPGPPAPSRPVGVSFQIRQLGRDGRVAGCTSRLTFPEASGALGDGLTGREVC